MSCVDEDRVPILPGFHLGIVAVSLRVSFVVTVPPIGGGLDDRGTSPAPGRFDDPRRRRRGRGDIVAVDGHVVDAVPRSPMFDAGRVLGGHGRELGISVVLAPEDHRELPYGGQVDRFVERTLCHRAVPEEGDDDTTVAFQLSGRRGPDRNGKSGGDDSVGTENSNSRVGDVHRSAPSTVGAGILGHQLGEHPERSEPFGQAMSVSAVVRRDHVRRP